MKPLIRVLIIEDHLIARIGIATIVGAQPDLVVVGEAVNGAQGVELFRRLQPDVTLMDLRMSEMNGAQALQIIRGESPNARIIVLSSHSGDAEIRAAFRFGASGYVLKDVLEDELINAVRVVHAGRKYIPANVAEILAEHLSEETLTASEQKILKMVVAGASNRVIAEQLFVSENTVKTHLKNIFAKLAVKDRAQAVAAALKRGLVAFDE